MFSFNNPFGACKKCGGLGSYKEIDPDLVIPNKNFLLIKVLLRLRAGVLRMALLQKCILRELLRNMVFHLMFLLI